jgi:hypothetical protein
MEAVEYRRLCRLIDQASPHGRAAREQFSNAVIAKVYFWSNFCVRSVQWACDPRNWPEQLREELIGDLPSQPTMSRRMRSLGVLQLIERMQVMLAQALQDNAVVKAMDSKPLVVGNYSKDRQAKRGRAAGERARGYKLHVISCGKAFVHWTLMPMNCNDQVGAAMLLPRLRGWGYVTADNGYDANAVYQQAWQANHQLVAPPRPSNAGVRDVRRNTSQRIRSLDLCANPLGHCGLGEGFGGWLQRQREQLERNFGNATMCGLYAPPPWVRTPHRVAAWAAAKIIQCMLRQVEIARLTV